LEAADCVGSMALVQARRQLIEDLAPTLLLVGALDGTRLALLPSDCPLVGPALC